MRNLFLTILFSSILVAQEGKLAVSILDFTGDGVEDRVLRACYQKLETSLIESNQYTVIAKNQREEILKEMKFNNSGLCDEECAIEIGQLVGAEYLMLGEIIGFADLYQVNIKIVNIENGDVVEKVTKEIEGKLSDLLNGMAESSREITRRISSGIVQSVTQPSGLKINQKKYGGIIIESSPSGATILIDNVKKGATPLKLNKVEAGTRKLKLIKTGYITINKGVVITENLTEKISEVFIHKTGDLAITSEPSQANIYLNGTLSGKTPLNIPELKIGGYEVKISSDDHYIITEKVIVEYDRKNSRDFILQPKPGKLTIIVTPNKAKKSIGSKTYTADQDGISVIELPNGQHNINFNLMGYKSITKKVTILPNEKKSMELQMYLSQVDKTPDNISPESFSPLDPIETASWEKSVSESRLRNRNNIRHKQAQSPKLEVDDGLPLDYLKRKDAIDFSTVSELAMYTKKSNANSWRVVATMEATACSSFFDDDGEETQILPDSIGDVTYHILNHNYYFEYGLTNMFQTYLSMTYRWDGEEYIDENYPYEFEERNVLTGMTDITVGIKSGVWNLLPQWRAVFGMGWKFNNGKAKDDLKENEIFPTGSGQNDINYFIDSDFLINSSTLFSLSYAYVLNMEGKYDVDNNYIEMFGETFKEEYTEKPGDGQYYLIGISKHMTDYAYFGLELRGGVKQHTTIDNQEINYSDYEYIYIKPSIGFGNMWGIQFYYDKAIYGVRSNNWQSWGMSVESNFKDW